MKFYNAIFFFFVLLTFVSCGTDEELSLAPDVDLTWEEVDMEGPSATIKGFECGDMVTRSSWQFNGQKMVFGWEKGDVVGLYPTAGTANIPTGNQTWDEVNTETSFVNPSTQKHPYYDTEPSICLINKEKSQSTPYNVYNPSSDSQTQQLFGGDGAFEWDNKTRWTAYKPYKTSFSPYATPPVYYNAIPFDFSNQTQEYLTDMKALYVGTEGYSKGYNNPVYIETETKACKHLATADVSFSPEMVWNNERINFEFRHIGAIARLFLLAPSKNLKLVKLELICQKKIFHTKGEINLTSHMFDNTATNKGVKLVGDDDELQMKYTDEAAKNLVLNFPNDHSVVIKPTTADNKYSNYLVAYLMMYPIKYDSTTDGDLFVYVTALDENNNEVHFVSNALASKTMKSGYYYQWTSATHEDDGLYPIELTATLLPWQDIIGGGIETDLTK